MFGNEKEMTYVTAQKEAALLLERKILGPFKKMTVLALPETTEQERYS
jgi:hypothetical protein